MDSDSDLDLRDVLAIARRILRRAQFPTGLQVIVIVNDPNSGAYTAASNVPNDRAADIMTIALANVGPVSIDAPAGLALAKEVADDNA